jgi:hypothetical protein
MWGLSLGVVLTENDVNLGDALCSEVERFNLLRRHAKKNFSEPGIGLLLREDCQLITQVSEFLWIKPRHLVSGRAADCTRDRRPNGHGGRLCSATV